MDFFPNHKSPRWLLIVISVFALNFVVLLFSRYLLKIDFDQESVIGFAILASVVALPSGIGFFGVRFWELVILIGNILALAYLLFLTATNASEGWTDLTSIAGFMTLNVIAVIAGSIIELGVFVYRKSLKK